MKEHALHTRRAQAGRMAHRTESVGVHRSHVDLLERQAKRAVGPIPQGYGSVLVRTLSLPLYSTMCRQRMRDPVGMVVPWRTQPWRSPALAQLSAIASIGLGRRVQFVNEQHPSLTPFPPRSCRTTDTTRISVELSSPPRAPGGGPRGPTGTVRVQTNYTNTHSAAPRRSTRPPQPNVAQNP